MTREAAIFHLCICIACVIFLITLAITAKRSSLADRKKLKDFALTNDNDPFADKDLKR